MKKRLALTLAAALLLAGLLPAYGAGEQTQLPDLSQAATFEGPVLTLTFEEVLAQRLSEGPAYELVQIRKKSDEAVARGYRETSDTLQLFAPSSLEARLSDKTRQFARENQENNYQADLNKLHMETVQLYYGTLAAQEYYGAAWDDRAIKEQTARTVQRKYQLGAASRLDAMVADKGLADADAALAEALKNWYAARMNFNLELGLPLLQDVALTEALNLPAFPQVDLDAVLASAVEKRNEIRGVRFAYDIQEVTFTNVKLTTSALSSSYRKQEVAYLEAKERALVIEDQMRMDVLVKYLDLGTKHLAALAAAGTRDLAQEGLRIARIRYDAGMSTLTDLQEAEVALHQARVYHIGAVTDLILATYVFDFAGGVGTFRIDM